MVQTRVGEVELVESRATPPTFGVVFGAGRVWQAEGGAERVGVLDTPGTITVALRTPATLYLNGTRPWLAISARKGGLWITEAEPRVVPTTQAPAALVEAILAEHGAKPWLAEAVRAEVAAGGPLHAVVGLGMLSRLWAGSGKVRDPAAAIAKLLEGGAPSRRVAEWWSASRGLLWPATEAAALAEVANLAQELDTLGPSGRAEALRWLKRRDDLRTVEHLAGPLARPKLRPVLATLDRAARKQRAAFAGVDAAADERLRDVRWMEPDAWWAAVEP